MVELADTQDLGSCAARYVGSSPTTRTKKRRVLIGLSFFHYGAAYEARTRYLHLGKVALYRMS